MSTVSNAAEREPKIRERTDLRTCGTDVPGAVTRHRNWVTACAQSPLWKPVSGWQWRSSTTQTGLSWLVNTRTGLTHKQARGNVSLCPTYWLGSRLRHCFTRSGFIITYSSLLKVYFHFHSKLSERKQPAIPSREEYARKRRASYLYEKFHEGSEVNSVSSREERLKEPDEQAEVVSAVFLQALRTPPHVTFRERFRSL